MSQSFAEALSWVPVSAVLSSTLGRGYSYAQAQGHRTVTLEHLLLALAEDPDAAGVLQASNIDVGRLTSDASAHLGHIEDRYGGDMPNDPTADEALIRILDYAAAAARQSKRREINGAIVLAAIVGEARSAAASMLQAQGLTFEGAVRALQRATPSRARPNGTQAAPASVPPPPSSPAHNAEAATVPPIAPDPPAAINGAATQTNEQILASVRRRIDANRSQKKPAPAKPVSSTPVPVPQPPALLPAPPIPDMAPAPQPVVAAPPLPASYDVSPPVEAGPVPPAPTLTPVSAEQTPEIPYGALTPPAPLPEMPPSRPHLVGAKPEREEPDGRAAAGQAPPRAEPTLRVDSPPWQDGPEGLRRPPPLPPVAPPSLESPGQLPRPALPPIEAVPSPLRPKQLGAPVAPPSTVPWPAPVRPQPAALPPSLPPRRPPSLTDPAYFDGGIAGPPYLEPDSVPPPPVNVPVPSRTAPPRSRTGKPPAGNAGQPIENIPRVMQVGRIETVEIRIARSEVADAPTNMPGANAGYLHDLIVTKALSVRLRGSDGRFQIEAVSPETQWLDNDPAKRADDFASWRWNVTPLRQGKGQLHLIIATRTIASDGLTADTALPEQAFEISVSRSYTMLLRRIATMAGFMLLGAVLSRIGQNGFQTVATMLRGFE